MGPELGRRLGKRPEARLLAAAALGDGRLQPADLRIFGLGDTGATERHAREGHRPRVCEVTGRQRDIFDRLGYGLPTTS